MTQTSSTPIVLWLRRDLRLNAHPAWQEAFLQKRPVIPVYIWSPDEETPWPHGEASRWWLHYSLKSLATALTSVGSRLIFRTGPILKNLHDICEQTGANTLFWSRLYEPHAIARDTTLKSELQKQGRIVHSFNASLLVEPWEHLNNSGKPYQVFTPYWKSLAGKIPPFQSKRLPSEFQPVPTWPTTLKLDDLKILPAHTWHRKLATHWQPGEVQALKIAKEFLENRVNAYKSNRDFPAIAGTSRLSPYLHFGEISPRQIWDDAQTLTFFKNNPAGNGTLDFLREIAWREFSHSLLYHLPATPTQPLQKKFENFPWQNPPDAIKAWQRGATGYPIVDAGMRELWQTGFMHNRVRMIVASFLTKDLFVDWQIGAKWFWDCLVDADLANNTQGWQWTAGCGADAAPYFRIFNPVLQGEKFDPEGDYVKRFVPELAGLPKKWIHKPFLADQATLQKHNITLGKTYPYPIVAHSDAREHALKIWQSLSEK